MTVKMNGGSSDLVIKIGSKVAIRKDSMCAYADRTLTVKNNYSKNGNWCVDLVDKVGELLVLGMSREHLRKAR